MTAVADDLVVPFSRLSSVDVPWAGGKGANLGELTSAGLPVPNGFVVGAPAYAATQSANRLREPLESALSGIDVDDTGALQRAAESARRIVRDARVPEDVERAIRRGYGSLAAGDDAAPVAVRSSATSEDTASASFAGMNESFLNVRGSDAVVDAVRDCWASLFGARTIFYRAKRGLPLVGMEIAVVVQRQIESLRAGVMFTADPAGDPRVLVIEAALGLGESVVSGAVTPDRYVVEKAGPAIVRREVHDKALAVQSNPDGGTRTRRICDAESAAPALSDDQVLELAELGLRIESHYGSAQDTEWAFDADGAAWILQARPVTTGPARGGTSQAPADGTARDGHGGSPLVRGLAAAPGSASGAARVILALDDAGTLHGGDVLVAPMTAPDWVPLLRRAAALVTDSGGMTCHAAIVARELGIPCVVGTGDATKVLRDGETVAVDGDRGLVLPGTTAGPVVPPAAAAPAPGPAASATGTLLLVNLSEPSQAQRAAGLPVDGVGLLRAEMMLLEALDGTHPRELLDAGRGADVSARMAQGLTAFAEAFAGRPITYRTIDFRTNEFRGLRGGDRVEPTESNPMIGYRGALRAVREPDLLELELDAVRRVWDAGHRNLHLMVPFVRSARELRRIHAQIAASGLLDRRGFELWIMAEVPSVLFELPAYAAIGIDGISIGSNDLTQLLLGADRDSPLLGDTFDERDPAVQAAIHRLIEQARDLGLRTSLCGQAPSVHPEYAELLVRAGIDAVSVSVDAVDRTRRLLERAERRLLLDGAAGR